MILSDPPVLSWSVNVDVADCQYQSVGEWRWNGCGDQGCSLGVWIST